MLFDFECLFVTVQCFLVFIFVLFGECLAPVVYVSLREYLFRLVSVFRCAVLPTVWIFFESSAYFFIRCFRFDFYAFHLYKYSGNCQKSLFHFTYCYHRNSKVRDIVHVMEFPACLSYIVIRLGYWIQLWFFL